MANDVGRSWVDREPNKAIYGQGAFRQFVVKPGMGLRGVADQGRCLAVEDVHQKVQAVLDLAKREVSRNQPK